MEREAVVVQVKENTAWVHLLKHSACANCGACGMSSQPEAKVVLPAGVELSPGDRVKVLLKPSEFLGAVLLVYLLPLFFFIFGYLLGERLFRTFGPSGWEEAGGVLFGALLMLLCYLGIHQYEKRLVVSGRYQLKLEKIIESNSVKRKS